MSAALAFLATGQSQVLAVEVAAAYTTGLEVPVTANGYTATGETLNFNLNYAPTPGSQLWVVNNTGLGFISGTFENLAQGETVALTYEGLSYHFVANYYGGTGNDLVLVWKNTRAYAWGSNPYSQLGNNGLTNSLVPVPVSDGGLLKGKTVLATSAGEYHSLALCSDGTVAAWGSNSSGRLGNNSSINSSVPVAVDVGGALAGKTVVAVAASSFHSLALCSDGTVAAWGSNSLGRLGNNSTADSSVPVAVKADGVLAGKTVVAVSVGHGHSLALCSDGTVAAWGYNYAGQLGNNSTANSLEPVLVNSGGVLAGKIVKSVSAGANHSLALCSDGTLAVWGDNFFGQLGNNSTAKSLVPVAINGGVLAGKIMVAMSGGKFHSLALSSDGIVTAWGYNSDGELGTNSTTFSFVPTPVFRGGILAGKVVKSVSLGAFHSLALCSDGTAVAWGLNDEGQVGNNSTATSFAPKAVTVAGLSPGERILAITSGAMASHSVALVAPPMAPFVTSHTADEITGNTATLGGTVQSEGNTDVTVRGFVYAPTATNANPQIGGEGVVNVTTDDTTGRFTAKLTGLSPQTAYSFAAYAVNSNRTSYGSIGSFTTLDTANADLSGLALSTGPVVPNFQTGHFSYVASVPVGVSSLSITPTAQLGATITVNGIQVANGTPSGALPLLLGDNILTVSVTSQDGLAVKTYTVSVSRVSTLAAAYHTGAEVPLTVNGFTATGSSVVLSLNNVPAPGTRFMVVNNTSPAFITGTFENLAQGQTVALTYGGISYDFVANYFGGTGNDLVLVWKNNRVFAWGSNSNGQLGNNSQTNSLVPVPVRSDGVLAGKTVISVSSGNGHSLALCSDGTIVSWGNNTYGRLGTNSTANSLIPVAVKADGVLAGKTVVAVAAGDSHNLALCSDGTVASWGGNFAGQLGNNSTTSSSVPVAVKADGVLAGKTVVAVSAGWAHSLALCSDGTVVTWGSNSFGQLGNNSEEQSLVPVAVTADGVLSGKTMVAVSAGSSHCLVLCSDGTLVSWGSNGSGELGNNSQTKSWVPVAVKADRVLVGKTVVSVSAGHQHSLALCSDGTVVAWGVNVYGQLGENSTQSFRAEPVAVKRDGVLAGKRVAAVSAGYYHSLAFCADGTAVAWGQNDKGQLGNDSTSNSILPMALTLPGSVPGGRFAALFATALGSQSFALVGAPMEPTVTTLAPAHISGITATLGGTILAEGNSALTARGFVYAPTATNANPRIGGEGVVLVAAESATANFTASVAGLSPLTSYTFVAYASNGNGTAYSAPRSFTTLDFANADLSGLVLSTSPLSPPFMAAQTSYVASVPLSVSSLTVTPTAQLGATITVNGFPVVSGSPSEEISLIEGENVLTVSVAAENGTTIKTYTLRVTRVAVFTANYATGTEVPVTAHGFSGTGATVEFTLNHAPHPGSRLMVVNNTAPGFISGTFDNLVQGQAVALTYDGVIYDFVANYYGGSGNDLVLVWKKSSAWAWGDNGYGQLGNNSSTDSSVPVPVRSDGVLAGKTVLTMSASALHCLALCSDGTVAAWGRNDEGQLGNNSTSSVWVPVAVDSGGVLAGKTVVAVSSGQVHSLALCSDGTVAAWGYNGLGQLGNNSTTSSSVPVAVNRAGFLSGKTVVAVSAGGGHSLVLCSDGTVAAWGRNVYGQLGNNSTNNSSVPVAVDGGVLASKIVVAVSAGDSHSLALCSDGTVAAWGYNYAGQLGNNKTVNSLVPVAVNNSGILAGKKVASVAAGNGHNVAQCIDGTLVAWGANNAGQLGNNSTTNSSVPVAVWAGGALTGKQVVSMALGASHSLALCSDGTAVAWGSNDFGQLGSQSLNNSLVPVVVSGTTLTPGARFAALFSGATASHSLALAGGPTAAVIPTPTLSNLSATLATLNGTVLHEGNSAVTARGFVYAPTEINATPRLGGEGVVSVTTNGGIGGFTVNITDLTPLTDYSLASYATNGSGTSYSSLASFTTLDLANADLAGLVLSTSPLVPHFLADQSSYEANVPLSVNSLTVTPTTAQIGPTITVNGFPVASGSPSGAISLSDGDNTLTVSVTAQDGITTKAYIVTVKRGATRSVTYTTGNEVAVTAPGFTATGITLNLTLNHAPALGSQLMVVNNTGLDFISGTFHNLAQWQTVSLAYEGIIYDFVANYHGGTGNDLVLAWKANRPYAWGYNFYGQLSGNNTDDSPVPVAVNVTGALQGRTVVALSAGGFHSLAICSDGTVAAWGLNSYGQLGNNSTVNSSVPVPVTGGVLAGKTVVALSAGGYHSLAMCSDGMVAAWGANTYGQLGNNSTVNSSVPVSVAGGVLEGKMVVALSAGWEHSLALCSDGTVVAWGINDFGQLGNGGLANSTLPVAVAGGVLAGKTVVAVSAGWRHSLALCSDGTVAIWGSNTYGQLGNNSTADSLVPVAVNNAGVLAGRKVVSVSAGFSHSLALCSDGTPVAWGSNGSGQLGNNDTVDSWLPVAVDASGILAGKTIVAISAVGSHSVAQCSDGTVAAWGYNSQGQLGNGSLDDGLAPGAVTGGTLSPGERFAVPFPKASSYHNLALVATPMAPIVTSTKSTPNATTATLGGNILNEGNSAITERGVVYSLSSATSNPRIGDVDVVKVVASGTTGAFTVNVTNLVPATNYTFAAYATNRNGTTYGDTESFTTSNSPMNWRQKWYGTSANTGNAADDADPHATGVRNLEAYAFLGLNQDPATAKLSDLPQVVLSGNSLTFAFDEPAGVGGITYGAEWSQTMAPGSWFPVTDGGTGRHHVFSVPVADKDRVFIRLTVIAP